MEVRRCQFNVAQRWRLENVLITGGSRYLEPALVVHWKNFGPRILNNSEREISCAAQVNAVMTADTALGHKYVQPFLRRCVDGISLALEILIKARTWRNESRFERLNRTSHVFESNRLSFPGERLFEMVDISRD